jgi:heterotetrameric sarcosine oxidase gamma subunit
MHPRPSALLQAGIADRRFSAEGLQLNEIEDPVLLRLHSLEDLPGAGPGALALPDKVGQVGQIGPVSGEKLAALCLASGEWLLVGCAKAPPDPPSDLAERLHMELATELTMVCDQSDALAGIRVAGPAAPWLLGKLSCLDFARGTAAGPHCARTRMGDAAVVVHHHEVSADAWVFDLYVDRSVAHWLWRLLCASVPHAAELNEEFGAFA